MNSLWLMILPQDGISIALWKEQFLEKYHKLLENWNNKAE